MPLFSVKGWGLDNEKVAPGVSKSSKGKKQKNEKVNKVQDDKRQGSKHKMMDSEKDDDTRKHKKQKHKADQRKPIVGKNIGKQQVYSDQHEKTDDDSNKKEDVAPPKAPMNMDVSKLTPLQKKMLSKLSGSRFRWINEQFYTTDSDKAFEIIRKQPDLFEEYHKGFRSQVESWPENPVDLYIKRLVFRGVSKPANSPGGLPGLRNDKKRTVVVADMGCGEAELATQVDRFLEFYRKDHKKALKVFKKKYGGDKFVSARNKRIEIKVHSFDLDKVNDNVTVADIKNVPMDDESCTVVVFCLSLMGTNFLDFIKEAYRILTPGGELWIAEIQSRLADSTGEEFSNTITKLGFRHKQTDTSNKMFTRFDFFKPLKPERLDVQSIQGIRESGNEGQWLLKPCIYKRR